MAAKPKSGRGPRAALGRPLNDIKVKRFKCSEIGHVTINLNDILTSPRVQMECRR